jgi:glycosyltransferase involved in cell wall biosynthesis
MRILFISSALHKEFGGPPVAVLGAALSLAKLGHQVTVFVFGQSRMSVSTNNDFYEKLKSERIEVIIAKSWKTRVYGGIGSISDIVNLFYKIKSNDIVSMHQVYNYQNIMYTLFCLITKIPFTVMPHGTLTKYQKNKHFLRKIFVKLIFVGFLLKQAKEIFVATQIEKNEMNSSLKPKTVIVGLGILMPEIRKSVEEYESGKVSFNFLYMGRIAPKKRLDIAIEAFYCLPEEVRTRSKLVICGSGDSDYIESMVNRVNKFSLADRVDFKGWVSAEEKSMILNSSDCFLLTSEDENFAIAAGEALAYGVPCILSTQVALSSLVEKYNAGKVFSNLDPSSISKDMLKLFNSDKNEMRKRALRASEELTWEFVSKNWDRALMRVIGNSK